MNKNNPSYLLIAATISLTSLPLGTGLTKAALLPTAMQMGNSHLTFSTSITQPRRPQLIARANDGYSYRLLALINFERRKVGAPPLKINFKLTRAALGHSQDMATHNFFSHTGSNGSQLSDRVNAAGYSWRALAENIAAGQSTPGAIIQSWLNSPPHKQNLLNPLYKEVGFGYAVNTQSTYKTYWTADFAKPL